jgi:hypothetical protein
MRVLREGHAASDGMRWPLSLEVEDDLILKTIQG